MSCAQLNPKQVSDNVFNSKSKHESAKYYSRLAMIAATAIVAVGYATGRGLNHHFKYSELQILPRMKNLEAPFGVQISHAYQ